LHVDDERAIMAQQKHEQKSKVLKRSVVINGHKSAFWDDPAGGQSAAVTAKECILTMTADRASELELANDQ